MGCPGNSSQLTDCEGLASLATGAGRGQDLKLHNSPAMKLSTILNPLCDSTTTAAVLRREARCMKEAGQSPRDPSADRGKPRSNPGQDAGMRRASGTEGSSNERLFSRRTSTRVRLDVRRLRDESVAHKYRWELAESLSEPSDSDDPEQFWTDFQTKMGAGPCQGGIHSLRGCVRSSLI